VNARRPSAAAAAPPWSAHDTPLTPPPRFARGRSLDRARTDRALLRRYHDERDPVDQKLLVERFLPLARDLASRYRCDGASLDDLVQVACVGLVQALNRFDPERGVAFSSFAVPTILGELRRYLRDSTWSIHAPAVCRSARCGSTGPSPSSRATCTASPR
jgi:RNA polymerase sigma-B factor